MNTGIAGIPLRDVAPAIRDVWLRFHEADLCLGIDTVFVFQSKGMEAWCRIKDERNYQQFSALVEPLQKIYRIELYPTHADREKKPYSPEDDNPPPSFWTNAELRGFLRDANFSRFGTIDDPEGMGQRADPELKRRLKLFGDDILSWTAKMQRLAIDLSPLAGAAFGADPIPDIRARSRAVCLDHARELGRCAGKLSENLGHALPRGSATPGEKKADREPTTAVAPFDSALEVSRQAQEVSQRVLRFLYPLAHTVTLGDLREPSLVEELKVVQKNALAFENSARKAK